MKKISQDKNNCFYFVELCAYLAGLCETKSLKLYKLILSRKKKNISRGERGVKEVFETKTFQLHKVPQRRNSKSHKAAIK